MASKLRVNVFANDPGLRATGGKCLIIPVRFCSPHFVLSFFWPVWGGRRSRRADRGGGLARRRGQRGALFWRRPEPSWASPMPPSDSSPPMAPRYPSKTLFGARGVSRGADVTRYKKGGGRGRDHAQRRALRLPGRRLRPASNLCALRARRTTRPAVPVRVSLSRHMSIAV
jgi:hypothetical protein